MTTRNSRSDPNSNVNLLHENYFDIVRLNVSNLLKVRKLTLKDFAKENDWNYAALHKALNDNQTISLFSLVRLSKGFQIDVGALLKPFNETIK